MTREAVTRDSDGATVDVVKEEAEQADLVANAKRVILTDANGNVIGSSNPLPVDTEISVSGDLIVENVTIASLRGTVLSSSINIGTSPTKIPSSNLTERKTLTIRNNGSNTIFIGGSGVTTTDGYPLKPNESMDIDLDAGATLYGIVASGTEDLRVLEVS